MIGKLYLFYHVHGRPIPSSNTLIWHAWVEQKNVWKNRNKQTKNELIMKTECLCQMLPSAISTAAWIHIFLPASAESGQFSKPLPLPFIMTIQFPFISILQSQWWRRIFADLRADSIDFDQSIGKWRIKIKIYFEPSKLFLRIVSQRRHCAERSTKTTTTEVSESKLLSCRTHRARQQRAATLHVHCTLYTKSKHAHEARPLWYEAQAHTLVRTEI